MRHGIRTAPTRTFPRILAQHLTKMPETDFVALSRTVDEAGDFILEDASREALAVQLQTIDGPALDSLLAVLDTIYETIHESESPTESRDSLIQAVSTITDSEQLETVRHRLIDLLKDRPNADRRHKREWLEYGILDTALGFSSFVDIRPNFSSDRSRIEELVPVIVMEVAVRSQLGPDRSVSFQLPVDRLVFLKALVEDIDKKLDTAQKALKMGDAA